MTQTIDDVLGAEPAEDPFAGAQPPVSAHHAGFSFTSPRFLFAQLAARAGSVVPDRTGSQTVLNNFAIQVSTDPLLQITGTDLELRVIASTPAVAVSHSSGQDLPLLLLPAKRLQAILREAPDGDVEVSVKGDVATITAGTARWELTIPSDGEDYPRPPELGNLEWQSAPRLPLLSALKAVRHAVSRAGSRANLGQVDIRPRPSDQVMCMTACDSTRFAQVPVPGFPVPMRIPAAGSPAGTDELIRLLSASGAETIRVAASGRRLFFGVDSLVFVVHMLPLEYPDVWKLLLEPVLANTDVLTVRRDDLRQAISQVRINADEATNAIGLLLAEGQITVFARDKYGNRAAQVTEATWEGPERTLVVNHQFLAEMLGVHPSGECLFRLGKDKGKQRSPVLLRDEDSGVTGIINQMAASLVGLA
jgi:DNA polymerase III sliding clamp (beta) subunit (PCNA family)